MLLLIQKQIANILSKNVIQKQLLLLLISNESNTTYNTNAIQKQLLLLLITKEAVPMKIHYTYSKTTFVTVNQNLIYQIYYIKLNSKTTFVTVNQEN